MPRKTDEQRERKSQEETPIKTFEEKIVFALHGLIACISGCGAALAILKNRFIGIVCPVVVFLLPPAVLFLWILKKRRGITFDGMSGRYVRGFHLVFIGGWFFSFLPGIFYGLLWFHILDPWPFSLQQGPDTSQSAEGFEKTLGMKPGREFRGIYFKDYSIRDSDAYLRFTTDKKDGEEKILAAVTKATGACKDLSFHLNARLSWWFLAAQASELEYWEGERKAVWIDRKSGTYFVRSWSF